MPFCMLPLNLSCIHFSPSLALFSSRPAFTSAFSKQKIIWLLIALCLIYSRLISPRTDSTERNNLSANSKFFIICVLPHLHNLSDGEQEGNKNCQKAKFPCFLLLFLFFFYYSHYDAHYSWWSNCCRLIYFQTTYTLPTAMEIFKAKTSRTSIRGQSGSSVMQQCSRYLRALASLDMEIRGGGKSHAL